MTEQQKTIGLIVAGTALVFVSLLIDMVDISTKLFGIVQIVGLIVGILLVGRVNYQSYFRQPAAPDED